MVIKDIQINAAIFKQKREEKSLTTREVEEYTGVNRSTISNLETSKNIPDGNNLLKLMFFFDLSKEDIALRK